MLILQDKEKQVQRIRGVFHRQLSVPLANLSSTLLAYKSWEVEQGNSLDAGSSDLDGISSNVALAYQKALEMYNARAHLEEQLSRNDIADSEKLQEYMVQMICYWYFSDIIIEIHYSYIFRFLISFVMVP